MSRMAARLVLVSVVKDDITFSDPEFHKREMMLIGSRNALRADFEHVMASIAAPCRWPSSSPTARRSPRRLRSARWAHEKTGLIKAIVEI